MTAAAEPLLLSAGDCKKRMAEAEAEKALEYVRKQVATEAEKRLCRLQQPSGVSDDKRLRRAAAIINRAVNNGLTEVLVGRFSNALCTDGGRAINQQEPGWEETLIGLPKELFQFWKTYLQPKGYRMKFQIVEWPNGLPGDIGVTLTWG